MIRLVGEFDAFFNPNFTAILGMFFDLVRAVVLGGCAPVPPAPSAPPQPLRRRRPRSRRLPAVGAAC